MGAWLAHGHPRLFDGAGTLFQYPRRSGVDVDVGDEAHVGSAASADGGFEGANARGNRP